MTHDFKNFPELTNSQMQIYYFQSPHKQITEDFMAYCVKVIDGDTIRVQIPERAFSFPIRIWNLAAPEKKERGGKESQSWLENLILGKNVDVVLSPSRVEKWGRLLADIFFQGAFISEESVRTGHGIPWAQREEGQPIPDLNIEMEGAWL